MSVRESPRTLIVGNDVRARMEGDKIRFGLPIGIGICISPEDLRTVCDELAPVDTELRDASLIDVVDAKYESDNGTTLTLDPGRLLLRYKSGCAPPGESPSSSVVALSEALRMARRRLIMLHTAISASSRTATILDAICGIDDALREHGEPSKDDQCG